MLNNIAWIPLTQGKWAMVDLDDLARVINRSWHVVQAGSHSYAGSFFPGAKSHTLMHRYVASAPKGMYVDHVDGNTLDNRKCNLRVCTNSQNSKNRVAVNGFKGVGWMKTKGAWRARIKTEYVEKHLGLFDSAEDAATAYNFAAAELHGGFARFNTVPQPWLEGV